MASVEKQIEVVFNEGDAWFSLHDTIFEATGESLTKEEIKELFIKLPVHVSAVGVAWGLADTVFNDEVYRLLEKNNKDVSN